MTRDCVDWEAANSDSCEMHGLSYTTYQGELHVMSYSTPSSVRCMSCHIRLLAV